MDAWICRKTNGDPCDQSSSSGQINIGINVQGYDPWTQATATPGSLPNNQQYKHVYSRSERLAIAFRVLYEEEVRKDRENELATQKEFSEKLLDKEHYLKQQAKRLREIETQIVIQEGFKKLHAIHNLNLDESEIQTVNANLNMENPLGSYWLKILENKSSKFVSTKHSSYFTRIKAILKLKKKQSI